MTPDTMCPNCDINPEEEAHSCPFAIEVDDEDDEEYCTCCDECTGRCADDI